MKKMLLFLSLLTTPLFAAEEPILIYLMDAKEVAENPDLEKAPLTKKQERLDQLVKKDQVEFRKLLEEFLKVEFDQQDDQAKPEFNRVREKIVRLIFKAHTEKSYYERLYLINVSWLEHLDETDRFASLDKALRDRRLEMEAKRRKIREIVSWTTAVAGVALGGYLSYRMAKKILPLADSEKILSHILKWSARTPIILIGAGVGAATGQYVGFLGSDFFFKNREFIDPIDGTEDLRDLLDVIDDL